MPCYTSNLQNCELFNKQVLFYIWDNLLHGIKNVYRGHVTIKRVQVVEKGAEAQEVN